MRFDRRAGLAVGAGLALSLVIHLADTAAPPVMRLGLFYLVPVVLVTWTK